MTQQLWYWNFNRKPIPEDSKNEKFFKEIHFEGGKLALVLLAFLSGLWKRPKMEVLIQHLPNGFFWKFLHFWNPQVWVSYWDFIFRALWSLLFLAFMLWWAQWISDWLGLMAFTEASLRLDEKFWACSYPLVLGEYPHEVCWPQSQCSAEIF